MVGVFVDHEEERATIYYLERVPFASADRMATRLEESTPLSGLENYASNTVGPLQVGP